MNRRTLVAVALLLLPVTTVRADDDAIADAAKAIARAQRLASQGCPGASRTALAAAEAKVNALGEFDKDKVKADFDRAKQYVDGCVKGWGAEEVKRVTNEHLYALKDSVDQVSQAVFAGGRDGGPDKRFDRANAGLDQVLADELNKPLLTPELLKEIADKREGYKADYQKARVKEAVRMWDAYQHGNNRVDAKGWEDESETTPMEQILKLSWKRNLGCEKCQAFVDNLWDWTQSATVKTALERWDATGSLKKFADELDAKGKKATETITRMTKEILDQAEKLPQTDGRKELGFYYTGVLSKYGRESEASRAQHQDQPAKPASKAAKPARGRGRRPSRAVDDEDESEGDPEKVERPRKPFPAGNDTLDRIEALVNRWDVEVARKKDADTNRTKKLMSDAEEQWPIMVKALKAGKLDANDALTNPASWKGKVVVLPGQELAGRTYEAQTYSISEVDGIPCCGDTDPELDALTDAYTKRNHCKPGYNILGRIAVVEGTYKVWQRVKDRYTDKMVRGDQINGVKVRIIGYRWEYCSAAVGVGVSDELGGGSSSSSGAPSKESVGTPASDGGTDGGSESGGGAGVGVGGASGGGTVHVIHRFVAWGMCALLGLAGLCALAHGASRFHQPLEAQIQRLGDVPGYAGCALVLLGAGWFASAIVLPLVLADARFGSLPSVALGLAGAVLALDLVRSKGKLAPETAQKIQPVGILFGLACFPAAAVHFLFWDKILL